MVCRISGAKSKETRYSMLKWILQLTVLNLQMKKPICKCRTVIVVGSYTKPHFNALYLVSLLFAPLILHTTNHFLDREVFDLLVPIIFFVSARSVQYNLRLSVFVAMYRRLDSSYV